MKSISEFKSNLKKKVNSSQNKLTSLLSTYQNEEIHCPHLRNMTFAPHENA